MIIPERRRTLEQTGVLFFLPGGEGVKQDELKSWIEELIREGQLWKFYKSKSWIELKEEVLKENHYECAECRRLGKITRYDVDEDGNKKLISTVHHVQFVRKHPALALSKTYNFGGKTYRNLIPVCKACHNKLHPEKRRKSRTKRDDDRYMNEERW